MLEPETASYILTGPLVSAPWAKLLIVFAAYLVTLLLSGYLIKYFILPRNLPPVEKDPNGPRFDASVIIGKCENILVVTFVLLGLEGGIALVFTAKALARSEDIKKKPGFFLGGTMVNLIWAMFVALLAKALTSGI